MAFVVAIVGRPNVGKSTLFNRLVGRRTALVDDTPGLTRDRREGQAQLGDLSFTVVDTGGLEESPPDSLASKMRGQTEYAVDAADLTLFVIDARAGVTPVDRHFAQWLRKRGHPVLLLANKCESVKAVATGVAEGHGLGFGEPIAISAEHGDGLAYLHAALVEKIGRAAFEDTEQDAANRALRLAVVGRPNVGKSTLINRLVGEERVLVGPEPGITRDAIDIEWTFGDRRVRLVDTAGLRRQARIEDRLERLSTGDTIRAIGRAEVVALVLDGETMLEKQDLTIAGMAIEEGRALVIVVNKWDIVADRDAALRRLRDRLETSLTQVRGIPFVTLSALTGEKVDRFMAAVLQIHEVWSRRLPTPALNRWLGEATSANPPPMVEGLRPRLRFMTQVSTRPPGFALFAAKAKKLPESYMRYLTNSLRDVFDLPGVPVRWFLRAGNNPYVKDQ
ncbi:MAG: ribosome biogenesis GTPase Der [Rhodospirillaceae bacterium]|nr:ribosome biogenesis GTPase Der [Rhodospirillaceae bacterium]